MSQYDATVVGAGPNGLSAALEMGRAGLRVLVLEAADEIGGGTRSAELTLPGFVHDVCSAIHPWAAASPFFGQLDLEVDWIHPELPLSHPLGHGRAAGLYRSVEETSAQFSDEASRYRTLVAPLATNLEGLVSEISGPRSLLPEHPGLLARLAISGAAPVATLAGLFSDQGARALLAGLGAHSLASLGSPLTGAVALSFAALGHGVGWPLVRGGSERIAEALAKRIVATGSSIETGRPIHDLSETEGDIVLLDVMPPAAARIAGNRLPEQTLRSLRKWRPGPGVFKVDWALSEPIPWADPISGGAGTVHVGGAYEEIAFAEREVARGRHPERPFVLVAQQSLFDSTRAPQGSHTGWAYCHVPNGSTVDMTEAIEAQIERFAPRFRETILARATRNSPEYEAYNPSMVGGNIAGGRFGLMRFLQFGDIRPYRLAEGIYLCSAATPPGGGVHGMCGFHAARAAMSGQSTSPRPL